MMVPNMRIVISCVTFDTVKVVKPIRFFRADKAYLLHLAVKQPYIDFLNEVQRQLAEINVPYECIEVNVNEFESVMRELVSLIKREKDKGNNVYVNIGAGSSIYSSASLMACLMEGGIPFNVGVKDYMIQDHHLYYENKRPIGLARDVYDPFILPAFHLERPSKRLVEGLKIWSEIHGSYGKRNLRKTITRFENERLLEDCLDERGRVTHKGQMTFIRKYRDKWIKLGWMEKNEDGHFIITEYGKMIKNIF